MSEFDLAFRLHAIGHLERVASRIQSIEIDRLVLEGLEHIGRCRLCGRVTARPNTRYLRSSALAGDRDAVIGGIAPFWIAYQLLERLYNCCLR